MLRLRWFHTPVLATLILIPGNTVSRSQTQPDPYQVATFCIPIPAAKQTINVSSGDELQRALDQANGGDTIVLAEGSTYRPVAPEGSFMLRNRGIPAGQWVVIRSA